MELFAADGHDAGGCERVTGKSGMRPTDFFHGLVWPVLVGPLVPATSSTNPGPEVLVVELSEFRQVAGRLVAALSDATSRALPITLCSELSEAMGARELLWPTVFESMSTAKLRDLS